jgi:hypothetical protein
MSPGGWGLVVGIQCYGSGIVSSSLPSLFWQGASHSNSAIFFHLPTTPQESLPYGYEKRLGFDITLPARDHFLEWGRGASSGEEEVYSCEYSDMGKRRR